MTLPDGRSANPLAGLKAFQFLPPFLNVPNAVESGKTNDGDFSYSVRAAYELTDTVNIYATYATGFKASSINLSRDSRPLASDLPARSEEHTSELQSLMRISYAVFCLK